MALIQGQNVRLICPFYPEMKHFFFLSVFRLISSPFWAPKNMVLHTADRIRNTFDALSDTSSLRVQMVSLIREVNPCESKEAKCVEFLFCPRTTLHA